MQACMQVVVAAAFCGLATIIRTIPSVVSIAKRIPALLKLLKVFTVNPF